MGLYSGGLIIGRRFASEIHALLRTVPIPDQSAHTQGPWHIPYPISDQNGQNPDPISD